MHIPRLPAVSSLLVAILALGLPACSINVKKNADESDKKVDISTPLGGIHVSNDADVKDIGLPVYPGARPKQKEDSPGEEKSANVRISSPLFGLKVVAQEFESDDSPDKLIGYYAKELKKYGKVLECHNSWKGGNASINVDSEKPKKELTCDNDRDGKTTELKVGTEENQHIVAIEPAGKGSKFALVVVQVRGKDDMI